MKYFLTATLFALIATNALVQGRLHVPRTVATKSQHRLLEENKSKRKRLQKLAIESMKKNAYDERKFAKKMLGLNSGFLGFFSSSDFLTKISRENFVHEGKFDVPR